MLPARPYRVRSELTLRAWLAALGLAALSLAPAPFVVRWRAGAARELLEERHIWDEGAVARDVRGNWVLDKGLIFDDYRYDFHYTDERGGVHQQTSEVTSIRALDIENPVEVRYVGDRVAISAAFERLGDRWIAWYAGNAPPVMLTFGILFLAALQLRRWMDVRHAGDRSDEVELHIDQVERIHFKRTASERFRYHCHLPLADGRRVRCEVVFNAALGEYPLFSDEAQSRLLALVSPHAPRRPVIVRNDMYPYQLDSQQVKTMKERFSRQVP
jgi:hypothetical protein